MRTVVLRVVALAMLLLLALVSAIAVRTLGRLPDTAIYFVASRGDSFTLEPVGRRNRARASEDRARATIAALVAGPTPGEAARGLSSALPAELDVFDTRLVDGVLTVDVSVDLELGGGSALMLGRLNQLLYTLTQPHEVDAVSLRIEGDTVTVFGGEGILLDNPWWRAEHPDLPVW